MNVTHIGNAAAGTLVQAEVQAGRSTQDRPDYAHRAQGFPAPAAQEAPHPPTQEQLREVVDRVRQHVEEVVASQLQFSVDENTGRMVVSVTDRSTGELIRQIPPEEMMRLSRSLDEMRGILLRQEA